MGSNKDASEKEEPPDSQTTEPEAGTEPDATSGIRKWLKTRTGRAVAATGLVAVTAAALLSTGRSFYNGFIRRKDSGPGQQYFLTAIKQTPQPVGAAGAGVVIEACMGPAFVSVMQSLAGIAETWPDNVRTECYAYMSREGAEFVRTHKQELACIFINGTNEFGLDGGVRRVCFHGPPGQDYRIEDVIQAVRDTYEQVYGALPEGFDDQVQVLFTGAAAMPQPQPCAPPEGE